MSLLGNPEKSFRFLLLSRSVRSAALVFTNLSVPLYLSDIGFPVITIGLVLAGMALYTMLLSLFLPMIGDRIGFKRILIYGEIPAVFALSTLAFSTNWIAITAAVIVGGVGGTPGAMRGFFSPGLTAYVAGQWPSRTERQSRIGQISGVGSLSAITGGVLLTFHSYLSPILGNAPAFRFLFSIAAVLALISLFSLTVLSETRPETRKKGLLTAKSARYTLRVLGATAINGSAIGIGISILPLWWRFMFGLGSFWIGTIFSLSYLMTGVFSIVSSRIKFSSPHSALMTASTAWILQGVALALMALSPLFYLAAGFYVVRSAIAGFGSPIRSSINVQGIREGDFGAATGIQGMAVRMAQSSSGASGYLLETSVPLPEEVAGVLQMLAGTVYFVLFRKIYRQATT